MNPLPPKYKTLMAYAYSNIYEGLLSSVCEALDVPVEMATSGSRKRELVEARMIYFKLANETYPYSIKMIGSLANRSHSVVLSGAEVVDNVRELSRKYEQVKNTISWNKH